ncbi:MAG: TasA family protein [Patescibacteria group bacterium]|jgi:predicted ribosomally synthesized peptide with SipW-like signal peptide
MKKIVLSLSVIAVVAALAIGATVAYFSDTEISSGNTFTAGSIDLKVDHTKQTYNGHNCVGICVETGSNLILNGGFETPNVPSGGWAIYPDASLTSWTVESGAGLEIQDNAAGAPHGGSQLAELDSNNSSAISQTLTTVAGQQYRLTFWYSPRPNRPAGDNTIGAIVKVVSDSTILVNDTIGAASAGGSNTVWTAYTYNFIATDAATKVMFSDLGTNNSYGGYLDDISVMELNCTSQFEGGGICTLWGERDLGLGDTFWNFGDVKPGDWGTNVISLHVESNDAYVCMLVNNEQNLENSLAEPETASGDTGEPGELSQYLNLVVWEDDGDGVYEPGTESPLLYNGPFDTLPAIGRLPILANGSGNLGIAWCVGTQTVALDGTISCSGSGNQNNAQTDQLLADIVLYATQQRNNENFSCDSVALPPIQDLDY